MLNYIIFRAGFTGARQMSTPGVFIFSYTTAKIAVNYALATLSLLAR